MNLAEVARAAKRTAVEVELREKGYLRVGEVCIWDESPVFDTVDAFTPDGHEICVYYEGNTPLCEITDTSSYSEPWMSLWVLAGYPRPTAWAG